MTFHETSIEGAYLIEMEPRGDERGYFARAWCRDEFAAHGLSAAFVQANTSFSRRRGTLRGLHLQREPHAEEKLIRCLHGAIWDVVVDLRPSSPTYMQWMGVELGDDSNRMVYVPKGCAHGFQTLCDHSVVHYPVTAAYAPEAEGGVRWDDPALGIEWPEVAERIVSAKDEGWPDYEPLTTGELEPWPVLS